MGITSAGIFGDILTMRMMKRNVAALVTDGVVRDKAGVLASKLPVWCAGTAAPASVNGLTFVGWQEPIGCGGCAIFPDDIIVCDDDGAVVIPQDLLAFVAEEGAEHERMERFIVGEVERGAKLPGLYPHERGDQGALRRLEKEMMPNATCPGCGAARNEVERCTADPGPPQTRTVHASRVYPTCAHFSADLGYTRARCLRRTTSLRFVLRCARDTFPGRH